MAISAADFRTLSDQLGRKPRGAMDVVFRMRDGAPAVILTQPILADGTPFPTLYYLTDPRLVKAVSQLESDGVMQKMNELLQSEPQIAAHYRQAHEYYLKERDNIAPLGTVFSGGGMPDRVKCLHVLVAHSLAKGPGVNPIGDLVIALLRENSVIGDHLAAYECSEIFQSVLEK